MDSFGSESVPTSIPKMSLEIVSEAKCFGGLQKVYKHFSRETNSDMKFSLFEPSGVESGEKCNVLFYLSGMTSTEENFITKSGFQQYATEFKFIVVGPDTSPRGLNLPGETESWNFGEGAGGYLDALKEPWSKHYRMYSYITKELFKLIQDNFHTTGSFGIFGYSMGGHGALSIGLRNPELFHSISAFSPITNPINTKWGKHVAFKKYLGEENRDKWELYDSCELAKKYEGPEKIILVDQGLKDSFLEETLLPGNFKEAVAQNSLLKLNLRLHDGYDHSYYFVATFIRDHFQHHASILNNITSK